MQKRVHKREKGLSFWGVISYAIVFGLFFTACNSTLDEIDDRYKSGVVMIVNQYYYTMTLPDGTVFYLAGDGGGNIRNIVLDPDSAVNCMMTSTGTGFFISKDGKIATNKHVASRTVTDKNAVRTTKQMLRNTMNFFQRQIDTCKVLQEDLQIQYLRSNNDVEKMQIAQAFGRLKEEIEIRENIIQKLSELAPEDADIEYHSSLRVAYNETFVKTFDDLYPCTLRDTAEKDLAIIQLNSKQTPEDKYVFTVPEKNMLEHYSFGEYISKLFKSDKNEKLFLIAFNGGFDVAVTDEGIYSQCTDGAVSQRQQDKIMYTIPAKPGSSGGPVLNRRGQLVAVNFAGWRDAQCFNYGVKEPYLYELINKQ